MKKLILIITLLAFFSIGCTQEEQVINTSTTVENETNETAVESVEEATVEEATPEIDYSLLFRDTDLAMNTKMASILEALGEPDFYFEAESCAFQGMDRTYTYGGIEIHTYEMDQVDYIISILFLDDTIATNEGVELFGTLDDMIAAYGEEYTESLGLYTYEGVTGNLTFLVEENEIVSIEYMAILPETE